MPHLFIHPCPHESQQFADEGGRICLGLRRVGVFHPHTGSDTGAGMALIWSPFKPSQ